MAKGGVIDREEIYKEIADELEISLGDATVNRFSDGEIGVEIDESVRGDHVFVIQPTCPPVNENLMELMFILDALKRSNVNSVTVVLPYYGYARQDRKSEPRVPISAKVVSDMLQMMNINRVITVDLHAGQIQGFYDIPVDNLYASKVLIEPMANEGNKDELCVVSPDVGGMERSNYYSRKLETSLAICYKHRENPNEISEMDVLGNVDGKKCIIVDDIVDTCGTLCKASDLLLKKGAKDVIAYVTHGVFSGDALDKLNNSSISKIVTTDTIPPSEEVMKNQKFEIVTVSDLLAETIFNTYYKKSVSKLFVS